MSEEGQKEVNVAELKKIIKENSDCKKEYIVDVEIQEVGAIEDAFLKQISYELVISAIKDVEYEERWSVEE